MLDCVARLGLAARAGQWGYHYLPRCQREDVPRKQRALESTARGNQANSVRAEFAWIMRLQD